MRRTSAVSMRLALAVGVAAVFLAGALIVWRSSRALQKADEEVRAEHEFPFVVRPFSPPANDGFETVNSSAVYQHAARFQDHLFISGPTALFEFDSNGTLLHQYAAGSELPGSALIGLAPAMLNDAAEPELVLATADAGFVAF